MSTTLMKPVVSSIYGAELQTAMLSGIPYQMREHTTLNEKFDIQAGVAHNAGIYPTMRYIAIGNGGHKAKVGVNGIEIGEVLQHTPTHAALFNHLPFVVRDLDNDLTPQERERFALRRLNTYNGTRFVEYYLRRLDFSTLTTNLRYTTVITENGVTTTNTTEFEPTRAELSPVPEPLEEVGVNTLNGDYVHVEAVIPYEMTKWDLDELKNAANIIYGDERYAVISEVGLVSAVDKIVEGTSGGSGNFNYKEAICAQICAFISTDFRAYYHNQSVNLDINIGASEPMFKLVAP